MIAIRRAVFALVFASACTSGKNNSAPIASPTPTAPLNVPEGYAGLAWTSPRARVMSAYADLRPSKTNPKVLVRDTTANGMTATEAFFFDAKDGLEEVELRFSPKRTVVESAQVALKMDSQMGPHEVVLADDNAYQYAWTGAGTEVSLTYDLRDSVAFGPVIAWAPAGPAPVQSLKPMPSATAAPSAGSFGACFAQSVHAARNGGLHLTGVEGGRGKLTLVYESAGEAKEINLVADPKTTKLIGCAVLPRAATGTSALQFRAEAAIDSELARSEPTGLTFGGPSGLADLITLQFRDKRYVSLRAKAADALAASSSSSPR